MIRRAEFSPCRTYRYTLWREIEGWQYKGYVLYIMCNPSTVDENVEDPTVAKCLHWALKWGYGGICVANIFAFRSTDPKCMKAAADPIGPENDAWLQKLSDEAKFIIVAWGKVGDFKGRPAQVMEYLPREKLHCLKVTKDGQPQHPLYIKNDITPMPYGAINDNERDGLDDSRKLTEGVSLHLPAM